MTAIDAAKMVVEEKALKCVRPRRGQPGQYDVKRAFTGNNRGWVWLDLTTASAIVQVHEHLSEATRPMFEAMPLVKMADVAFKVLKRAQRAS